MRTVTLIESWDEYFNAFQPQAKGKPQFQLNRSKYRLVLTNKYVIIQQYFAGKWQPAVDIQPTFDLTLVKFTTWCAERLKLSVINSLADD